MIININVSFEPGMMAAMANPALKTIYTYLFNISHYIMDFPG